jgi:hypothetical protein
MQHRLPLPPPAIEVAACAVALNCRNMPSDRAPTPDLPRVVGAPSS